jgi:hypothetical protein
VQNSKAGKSKTKRATSARTVRDADYITNASTINEMPCM